MARTYWTDDRLDSAFAELRQELREFRAELRAEMGALRTDVHADLTDMRKQMLAGSVAIIVALIGVIGAVLVAAQ